MDNWKQSVRICANGFRRWTGNLRVLGVFILILLFFFYMERGARALCTDQDLAITPWLFQFIWERPVNVMLFFLVLIILFCDAPFMDAQAPYSLIRTYRKNWVNGQCLYVISASGIYTVFLYIASLLFCLPNLSFSTEWGRIIRMLSMPSTESFGMRYAFMGPSISPDIMARFQPIEATLLTLLFVWLISAFLGLLILTFNLRFPRTIGVLVAVCFVFLDFFCGQFSIIQGALGSRIYFFSPVSWCNLQHYKSGVTELPTISYAIVVLIVLIVVLCILSNVLIKNKDIEVLPEV